MPEYTFRIRREHYALVSQGEETLVEIGPFDQEGPAIFAAIAEIERRQIQDRAHAAQEEERP